MFFMVCSCCVHGMCCACSGVFWRPNIAIARVAMVAFRWHSQKCLPHTMGLHGFLAICFISFVHALDPPLVPIICFQRRPIGFLYASRVCKSWLPHGPRWIPLRVPYGTLGFPYDFPWVPIGFPYFSFGCPCGFQGIHMGIPMGSPLDFLVSHWVSLCPPWVAIGFPYDSHGFPKVLHWISIGFPWNSYWIPMGSPLDFLVFPIGFPWDSHEFPWGPRWIALYFPSATGRH